jgi:uncharacterized protein YndB with AHSA1/START domain
MPSGTSVVEHELQIAAEPETVFGYFTDPVRLTSWMGREAVLDPRPGGVCRLAITPEAVMHGEFVEVVPPTWLSFTWGWESHLLEVPPASTLVEVSLTPQSGGTFLRLVHSQLPEGAVEFHTMGWDYYVGRLGSVAAGEDPGPDKFATAAPREG